MISAQDLHTEHQHLMSNILFSRDEIPFIKDVIYDRSTKAENNLKKEKLDNFLEELTQLVSELEELETSSKTVESKISHLLETGTIKIDDQVFQNVKGLKEKYDTEKNKLKSLKKALFKLN